MSRKLHMGLVVCALLFVLGAVNFTVWQREHLLAEGTVVLLELAPVDPRSLMQGDYMALDFAASRQLRQTGPASVKGSGRMVIARDANGVGMFRRVYVEGGALASDEVLLRYRERGSNVRVVTNAYFFQEGTGDRYSRARYGELRVAADGEALLVGLRDANRMPIGLDAEERDGK